jgi:predicted metal-dependent hydrolase
MLENLGENVHDTEPKPFKMSNLRRVWGSFVLCKDLTISWMKKKLSWIFCPLMKVL